VMRGDRSCGRQWQDAASIGLRRRLVDALRPSSR